jgi:hypothetical protein
MFVLKQNLFSLGTQDPHTHIVTGSYIPSNPEEAEYGSVFFTYTLKDAQELAPEIRSIIIESFQQHFYQDLERDPEQSFEEVLQVINDTATNISDAEGITWQQSLNISLAVFSRSDLHLSVGGNGSVYLLRGKHLSCISEGLVPEVLSDNKIFLSLASGNLLKDDRILLSTELLKDIIDTEALKQAITASHHEKHIPALTYAGLAVVQCHESVAAHSEHVPMTMSSRNEEHEATPPTSPTPANRSKLSNTVDILKMNLKKTLERVFNRERPLVRKPWQMSKVIAIAVVVVVCIGAIYSIAGYQKANAIKRDLQTLVAQSAQDREDAKTRAIYDKESAKNLLLADQKKLAEALPLTNDVILTSQINGELSEIKQLLAMVDNVFREDNPKIAFDLSKERNNFEGRGLVRLNNDLYAFDSNVLYKLVVDKIDQRTVVVNGDTTAEVVYAAPISKDNVIELYTKDNKLIEFKAGNFTKIAAPGGDNAVWKNAVAVAEYIDRKFLYFLDPGEDTIWRYGRDANGSFQEPLSKNVAKLNYKNAVSLTVDGAVYVLSNDGTITKTYADQKQDFVVDGLSEPFKNPTKILADKNAETGKLYILDPQNSRVVVLGKSGKYQAQYVLPEITDLIDIQLVPSLTKDQLMILSKSGKVYQVELKQ